MKKLALTDFTKYRYPSALELSPDGRYLTFALKEVDREGDGYRWNLWLYIYENIAEPTFDSHRITNPFPQDFRDYYERMLIAHADEGDIRNRNVIIANRIGIYLGRNSRDLQIEKIGEVTSTNMNGEETPTSFWKKLG